MKFLSIIVYYTIKEENFPSFDEIKTVKCRDSIHPSAKASGLSLTNLCNPISEESQTRMSAKKTVIWNGDCWKSIVRFRRRSDVDIFTVNIDNGCSVILKRPNSFPLFLTDQDLEGLNYAFLEEHRKEILNLGRFEDFKIWLDCGGGGK